MLAENTRSISLNRSKQSTTLLRIGKASYVAESSWRTGGITNSDGEYSAAMNDYVWHKYMYHVLMLSNSVTGKARKASLRPGSVIGKHDYMTCRQELCRELLQNILDVTLFSFPSIYLIAGPRSFSHYYFCMPRWKSHLPPPPSGGGAAAS